MTKEHITACAYEMGDPLILSGRQLVADSFAFYEKCASCRTFQKDCPFFVCVAASEGGVHLEVGSLSSLGHNHDASKDLFKHRPQQRKLPPDLEEQAKLMLELKANKKLVRAAREGKPQGGYAERSSQHCDQG